MTAIWHLILALECLKVADCCRMAHPCDTPMMGQRESIAVVRTPERATLYGNVSSLSAYSCWLALAVQTISLQSSLEMDGLSCGNIL
jgi:hypothetical protein